jgi:transposase
LNGSLESEDRGRSPEDNRNIINGILWRLRTGAPWPCRKSTGIKIHCLGDARGRPIAFDLTPSEAAD